MAQGPYLSDHLEPGLPRLVRGEPDRISIIFCGERVTVNREWFDRVRAIANGPRRNYR